MPIDPTLAFRLREVVGAQVLVDPELVASYTADWTGRFRGHTAAVVFPASTEEAAGVVQVCRESGVAIVPQGGNTGLVGGGVPLHGEVVLNMGRLGGSEPVDRAGGQVTAGAGVTLAGIQEVAAESGWSYGVDFSSRASATTGGSVATNAGGIRVLRYGDTRAQLLGVEAVLGTGAVISHLAGLVKDNTGYDLSGLICGSEGTLAVVTRVRLRLVPPAPERAAALIALRNLDAALGTAAVLRRSLPQLEACEIIFTPGIDLVCSVFGLRRPFLRPSPVNLLIEVADRVDPTDILIEAIGSAEHVIDTIVATDSPRRAELWRYREELTAAINTLGPPHKLDVTLPTTSLAGFIDAVPDVVSTIEPTASTWLFGHVGDGNIHVNVTGLRTDDDRVDGAVFELVARLGGSISAEHGIGSAKRRWLHLSRSAAEQTAFRALKRALDPDGILNPHVLIPDA